jgi:subtilisin-like proprotein convertase family protein
MKKKLTAILAATSLLVGAQAQTTAGVFQHDDNAVIPDANPTGYTSTNIVSGLSGNIQSISVTLNTLNGYNGDLFAYLSYSDGYAVLLNRIGKDAFNAYGSSSSGLSITLSDTAATDIHLAGDNGGSQLTGTWLPDGRETNPQNVVTSDPRTALLSSFDNLNPNGTWTLFVSDMASGYQTTLVSWSLTIATVPEPASLQLLIACGGIIAVLAWRKRTKEGSPNTLRKHNRT